MNSKASYLATMAKMYGAKGLATRGMSEEERLQRLSYSRRVEDEQIKQYAKGLATRTKDIRQKLENDLEFWRFLEEGYKQWQQDKRRVKDGGDAFMKSIYENFE